MTKYFHISLFHSSLWHLCNLWIHKHSLNPHPNLHSCWHWFPFFSNLSSCNIVKALYYIIDTIFYFIANTSIMTFVFPSYYYDSDISVCTFTTFNLRQFSPFFKGQKNMWWKSKTVFCHPNSNHTFLLHFADYIKCFEHHHIHLSFDPFPSESCFNHTWK